MWVACTDFFLGVLIILILLGDVLGGRWHNRGENYCGQKGIASLMFTSGTYYIVKKTSAVRRA